jgi:hypothetical protein
MKEEFELDKTQLLAELEEAKKNLKEVIILV